ncbi:hypothetical protein TorRG33x02_226240 [Trema orientale]|uniref:Uncharacterized protein n=1 Tax=Trema orientale TaxID=63057 RepID=A0A2P5E7T0_TREOI|nr:hypothetical protein TorRG33x02_226240 [Trema orientale]
MDESGKPGGGRIKSDSETSLPLRLEYLAGDALKAVDTQLTVEKCNDLMPKERASFGIQYTKSKKTKSGLRCRRRSSMSFSVLSMAVMMSGIKEEGTSLVVSAPGGRPSTWGTVIA